MATKVLVIALDAADKDLISGWAARGDLPTFRRLEATALRGTVGNPFGLYVGAVWPSFFTGLSAARHGRYSFTQLVPGSYRIRAMKRSDVHGTPFWSALSAQGCRVAVIDVPKAPPTRGPLNGLQIVDWGLHETEVDGGLWTRPRSLRRSLLARYGPDPVGCCDLIKGRPDEYESLRRRLIQRIELKARMIRDVVREADWDLVLGAFADTHCAGHQLWHLHETAAAADAMRDVYAAADRALGALLDDVGDGAIAIVLASHGFGPYRGGNKILDDVLRAIDGAGAVAAAGIERRTRDGLRTLWKRWAPLPVKRALITVRQRTWHRVEGVLLRREYAHRRYFAVPNNDAYGAVRLNLVGREPRGRVRPEEQERVSAELDRELRALVDLDTGGPAVARVVRASEHYARSAKDGLPDLFVEWNGDRPVVRVRTSGGAVIEGYYPDYRTGDHQPEGAFWALGPGVATGVLADRVSIMDFAPTIGALLGVPLPGLDGRPIAGLTGERAGRRGALDAAVTRGAPGATR